MTEEIWIVIGPIAGLFGTAIGLWLAFRKSKKKKNHAPSRGGEQREKVSTEL